jgi:predicted nucleic acid-binding protein
LTLIVDSFAWVEFLSAGKYGPRVRSYLESSEWLITPDIVLAEVARVFGRAKMAPDSIAGHLRSIGALSSVSSIGLEVALGVIQSDLDLRLRARANGLGPPSFADCIILSHARAVSGRVLTADQHFKGLSETAWIGN